MTQWYYSKDGFQQEPVPENELLQKIRRGEIGGSNLVWKEGMAEWTPLSRMPELMGQASVAATAVISPDHPELSFPTRPQGGSMPLPQPPAFHGDYIAPRIPTYMWQSVVALLLSAGMMILICLPIGMPFAIVALVYAAKVEGLRLHGRLVEADSASKSAKLWMIISYAISGLIIVGFVVILLIALSTGGFATWP